MSNIVPAHAIEEIVGAERRQTQHLGRAVSVEEKAYILHSRDCLYSGVDLRLCPFSLALDKFGIDLDGAWCGQEDQTVVLDIVDDELVPKEATE